MSGKNSKLSYFTRNTREFNELGKYLVKIKEHAPNFKQLVLLENLLWYLLYTNAGSFSGINRIKVDEIGWAKQNKTYGIKEITLKNKILEVKAVSVNCEYLQQNPKKCKLFTQFSKIIYRIDTLIVYNCSRLTNELLEALKNFAFLYPIKEVIFNKWQERFRTVKSLAYYAWPFLDNDATVKQSIDSLYDSSPYVSGRLRNQLKKFKV